MTEYKVTTQYRLQRDPHTGQLTGKIESKGTEITMSDMTPTNNADGNADAFDITTATLRERVRHRLGDAGDASVLLNEIESMQSKNERLTRERDALRAFAERVANARLPFTANVIIEAANLLAMLESKTAPPDNE